MSRNNGILIFCALMVVGLACGCSIATEPRTKRARSSSPTERLGYIHDLGHSDSLEAGEELVGFLDDPDVVVRWKAHLFLERFANKHGGVPETGYSPTNARPDRIEGMKRWRIWLSDRRSSISPGVTDERRETR